jgi:hypothetical protein
MEASSEIMNCKRKWRRISLGFPPPTSLTGRKKPVPYFFVAEEAFTV